MPTFDEALDDVLLAMSRGMEAERRAVAELCETFPDRPEGRALTVTGSLWRGDLEEAQALASKLGNSPPELAAFAELASYLADRETAHRMIGQALAASPDDPIVLRAAYSIYGVDAPEQALEIAERRVTLRPHDPAGYAAVATIQLSRDAAQAQAMADDPPEALRNTPQLELLRARLAVKSHDLPRAEEHARLAVALGADVASAWATLSSVLVHQGKREEAERAAKFALDLNKRSSLAMRSLASIAKSRGDHATADEWERKASEAIPALHQVGVMQTVKALIRQGKREEALTELDKIIDIPGASRHMALKVRATLLIELTNDAALRETADAMEREGIIDPLLSVARAESLKREGRLDEASQILLEVWDDGHPSYVCSHLVRILLLKGDRETACRVAHEAMVYVPGTPADVAKTFLQLEKGGLKEEARDFLSAAKRKFPEAQLLEVVRVASMAKDGNVRGVLHAAQSLDPQYQSLFRLRIRWGKLIKAILRRKFGRRSGPKP